MSPRVGILAVLVALVAAVLAVPAGAAPAGPTLNKLTSAKFPDRAFVLSLPDKQPVTAAHLDVRENGEQVSSAELVPAARLGWGGFSTVLVIDSSGSMKGKPIKAAMRAARAFAKRRRPDQALGIVTFNGRAKTLLPLTTDPIEIEDALAQAPPLGPDTAIRDGALAAVRMLDAAHIAGGSIVVLSDGADTASRASMAFTVRAARRTGARVFSVGLKSGAFDSSLLEQLADHTGGGYSAATSPARLEAIFARLGAQLSNQYLLRYRSQAGPSERVHVAVQSGAFPGVARTVYTTPALPGVPAEPFNRSALDRFLGSMVAIVFISLACALLIGAGVLAVLRHRGGGLLERVGWFVPRSDGQAGDGGIARVLIEPGEARKLFAGARWMTRLREDLDVARIEIPADRLAALTGVATLLGMWTFATASGAPAAAVLAATVPVAMRSVVKLKAGKQRRAFGEQLADNVQILASAMRAGQSFVGALSVLVNEAEEPSKREFARALQDERLGKPIEEALAKVAERMDSEELDYVGLVARLQSETGGNTAEVLDRLVDTLRARADLRRLVRTLTSQGRMASWVISSLPVVILAAVTVLNRDYANLIFETTSGHVMLAISATLLGLGAYALRRIVDIKV